MGNPVHGPRIGFEHLPTDLWSMLAGDGFDAMLVVAREDGLRLDAYDQDALGSFFYGWDDGAGLADETPDVVAMRERQAASARRLTAIMRSNPGWPVEALGDTKGAVDHAADWTTGPDGRANTSPRFQEVTAAVERIIRDSGFDLINGRAGTVAGLIMAQLAHVHGLAPKDAAAPGATSEAP